MLSIISQVRKDKEENIVLGTFFKLLFCPIRCFVLQTLQLISPECNSTPQNKGTCLLPFFVSGSLILLLDFKSLIHFRNMYQHNNNPPKTLAWKFKQIKKKARESRGYH